MEIYINSSRRFSLFWGIFFLKAIFSKEYPKIRPEVCFITPIYHPKVCNRDYNVTKLGSMCISLLNHWNMGTKMVEVIANIYGLFYYLILAVL